MKRLLGAMLLITAASSSPADAEEVVSVFRCDLNTPLPEGGPRLNAVKMFRETGRTYGMHVSWTDNANRGLTVPQRPDDQVFVTLTWPGEHFVHDNATFNWTQGSITFGYLPANGANFRLEPGEEWRQVVVDRNGSARIIDDRGTVLLLTPSIDLALTSDLKPNTSPGRLEMSLDSFQAWGSNVPRLRVYETRVTRRAAVKNGYPTSPAGRRRIVGFYDVDMVALGLRVESIRKTVVDWERSLESEWRKCERTVEGGDIVLTTSERRH